MKRHWIQWHAACGRTREKRARHSTPCRTEDNIEWFTTVQHTTSGAASSVLLTYISGLHVTGNIAARATADGILQRMPPQKISRCASMRRPHHSDGSQIVSSTVCWNLDTHLQLQKEWRWQWHIRMRSPNTSINLSLRTRMGGRGGRGGGVMTPEKKNLFELCESLHICKLCAPVSVK